MKQCPACGNTYTNDQLMFCLEDGASLVKVSESAREFDPEATLRVDGDATLQLSDEEINRLAPTKAARGQRGAATTKRPTPSETVPPRARQDTDVVGTDAAAPKSNKALVLMLGTIALLLLVIAGIGVVMLLRSSSDDDQKRTENRALQSNGNRNVTGNVNSSTAGANSKPPSNANNANSRDTPAADVFARAEAKVVRGTPLSDADLTGLMGEELRRLRNSVYARHGRTFNAPELQRYFDSRPWYKPRADYTDAALTATDRTNLKLIQETETRR